MDYYKTYRNELDKLLDDEGNIMFFCDLMKYKIRYNSKECLELVNYVIEFCEKNSLNEAKAWMYYYLAWTYSDASDFENAIDIISKAKDIFEKYDNKKGLAFAYNGLTSFYCQNGQLELSIEIGLKGVSVARDIIDDNILLKLLLNISITNLQNKSYEAAKEIIEYIENTYNYSKLNEYNEMLYNKCMAEIEINTGDPKKAIKLIEQALEIDKSSGSSIFTTEGYKLLAISHSKLNMFDKAEEEFSLSAKIAEEGSSWMEKCETLFAWGVFKFSINEDISAVKIFKETIRITKENKFNLILKNSSKLLYEYYKKINNHEIALTYLELYMQADREINNYKSMKLMAQLNVEHGEKEMNLYKMIYDKTEILFNIGQKIISDLDVDSMIIYIDKVINGLIKTDYTSIAVYNKDTDEIVHRTVINDEIVIKGPIKLGDKTTLSEYCIRNKKTVFMNDSTYECKRYTNKVMLVKNGINPPQSLICIPLIVKNEVIGVLSVQSMEKNIYRSNDVSTLKVLGNYAAIALKNAIQYKNMEQIAIYDSLTGYLTKREIIKEGNKIRDEFIKTENSFCIFMIDIDNFKNINDSYGHLAGDKIIKMVTQTIRKHIRTTDYIGRYGGDEFLLVCQNMNKKAAIKLAEKCRMVIEHTSFIIDSDLTANVTISIGIYEFNSPNISFMEGINFADLSMYVSKNNNKNNVTVYEKYNKIS